MDVSPQLARFLAGATCKPALASIAGREELRDASHKMVEWMLGKCGQIGVLPESTLLASFVHVLPQNLDIDFRIHGIVRGSQAMRLRDAARAHARYVRESRISVFQRAMQRDSDRGWVGIFSHSQLDREASDAYDLVPSEGSAAVRAGVDRDDNAFAPFWIDEEGGGAPAELPTSLIRPNPRFVSLLGSSVQALDYVEHLSPLCKYGDVIVVAPQLHVEEGGRRLGGGGMMFVLDVHGAPKVVIDRLYLIAHRVATSTVEHLNIAHLAVRNQQFRTSLFAFGHHLGGLFQESELLELRIPGSADFDRMRSRLLHAWGIGEAMRTLKFEGRGFPRDWFGRGATSPPPVGIAALRDALVDTCAFLLAGRAHRVSEDWTVRWVVDGQRDRVERLAQLAASPKAELPTIPPFAKQRDHPASLALTLGLAEIFRNVFAHYRDGGFIDKVTKGEAPSEVLRLHVSVNETNASVRTFALYDGERRVPFSKAIRHIQRLEAETLSLGSDPVVRTDQFKKGETVGRCVFIEAGWTYWHERVRVAED